MYNLTKEIVGKLGLIVAVVVVWISLTVAALRALGFVP